ncbi:MAG: histidine kinase dimerization/phospho-acceptor domain-containing protein, partial [Myxococcota bacterium]
DFFETLDETAVTFSTPIGVDFILSFIGMRERKRLWILACYTWFCTLAALTACGLFYPPLAAFASSQTWSATLLIGLVLFVPYASYHAIRYAIDAASNEERQRTRTILLGVLIGVTLAPVDALRTLSPTLQSELPRMSDLGSLFVVALFYVAVSRARVSGIELGTNRAFQALSLMGVVLLAAIVSFFALRDDVATWFAVSATATAILVLVTYHWVQLNTEESARTRNLATLGRLSAQLAHDLRNPISAIKSASEFIEGERDAGRVMLTDEVSEYIHLIHEQADRMNTLVERYRMFSDQDVRR